MRVLLAGESWISQSTHYKGVDSFTTVVFESGAEHFIHALSGAGISVEHMPGHEVPRRFPATREELCAFDAVVLSDIGANSILLHPDTFLRGESTPNRLEALAEWVTVDGGGLMMAGGYLSFQGIEAKARYKDTPVERVLPVDLLSWDDRVETPQGVCAKVVKASHEIVRGVDSTWPQLLGYNRTVAVDGHDVIATVNDDPLIVAGTVGAGRTAVWTSDVGPHWCPRPFIEWDGYGRLMSQLVTWIAGKR